MEKEKICIATARINGLSEELFYCDDYGYYALSIGFFDPSSFFFSNLPYIYLGETEEEAIKVCNKIKDNFKQINISNNDEVAIIFQESGHVRAICCIGKDLCVDVDDNFVVKTFKDLNIVIDSLKIY